MCVFIFGNDSCLFTNGSAGSIVHYLEMVMNRSSFLPKLFERKPNLLAILKECQLGLPQKNSCFLKHSIQKVTTLTNASLYAVHCQIQT